MGKAVGVFDNCTHIVIRSFFFFFCVLRTCVLEEVLQEAQLAVLDCKHSTNTAVPAVREVWDAWVHSMCGLGGGLLVRAGLGKKVTADVGMYIECSERHRTSCGGGAEGSAGVYHRGRAGAWRVGWYVSSHCQ